MPAALLATLLVALEVHSSGDCPDGANVERYLGPLLGDGAAVSDVAKVDPRPDGSVWVSLSERDGVPIGDRKLPRARTCGEQAKTVAVTLAVWEAQLHPEISLRLDRLSPEPPPVPPRPPELDTTSCCLERVVVKKPPEWSLGLAALGDYQSDALAPGARLELALRGRGDSRLRARLAVVGVGRHTIDVPPGQATWWRAFAMLGGDADVARGRRWALVLGAGGLAGLASISGTGFTENHATRSLDLGAEARARLEWQAGRRVRPWLGAQLAWWARRQGLDLQGAPSSAALPLLEPTAALGADFIWQM